MKSRITTRDGKLLSVRKLTRADRLALQVFNDSLHPDSRRKFLPHRYDDATLDKALTRSEEGLDLTLGVFDSDRIVGYFFLWCIGERIPLLGIGILDEFHRRGLGQQLTAILIEEARNAGKEGIELTTMQDNDNAFALYQKMGFVCYGDVENTVGDGSIVVERALFYEIVPGAKPMQGPHGPPV
jgi:ribosomal protein S18 acetylase RimI-like enzyme